MGQVYSRISACKVCGNVLFDEQIERADNALKSLKDEPEQKSRDATASPDMRPSPARGSSR